MAEVLTAPAQQQQLTDDAARALQALQQEIQDHKATDHGRSYLDKAIDWVWRSDENSFKRLESLEQKAKEHLLRGEIDAVEKMRAEVEEAVKKDRKALNLQNDISFYGSTGLKVGALFLGGPVGWTATAGLYMLDEARPKDSLRTQILDAGLGTVKGLAFKGMLSGVLASKMPIALKGGIMSLGGRGLDTALSRHNYYDLKSDSYSFRSGIKATVAELTNMEHLAVDAAVMGTAYIGGVGLSKVFGRAFSASPLYTRVGTSSIAGFSRGAMMEISAARAAGEAISWSRVGTRALILGGVYGVAAVPGGVQAEMQARADANHHKDGSASNKEAGKHTGDQQAESQQFQHYKKLGTVRAEQLKQPMEWKSSNGDPLRGEAGDWKVTGPDGSTWTVKPDIFQQTYSAVPGSNGEFAKTAITKAMKMTGPMTVQTLEGPASGQAGDYLVVGPKGEQYIVNGAKFESMYRPSDPPPGS